MTCLKPDWAPGVVLVAVAGAHLQVDRVGLLDCGIGRMTREGCGLELLGGRVESGRCL